jgi:hypothetical protein
VTFEAPSQIANIPDGLFQNCKLLTGLCLPDSVIKIAGSAFTHAGITSLTARGFTTTGSLFTHFEKVVRCLGTPKSVVIPSTVREIGESAFCGISSLVELIFEEGAERIGLHAFCHCDGLKAVSRG